MKHTHRERQPAAETGRGESAALSADSLIQRSASSWREFALVAFGLAVLFAYCYGAAHA